MISRGAEMSASHKIVNGEAETLAPNGSTTFSAKYISNQSQITAPRIVPGKRDHRLINVIVANGRKRVTVAMHPTENMCRKNPIFIVSSNGQSLAKQILRNNKGSATNLIEDMEKLIVANCGSKQGITPVLHAYDFNYAWKKHGDSQTTCQQYGAGWWPKECGEYLSFYNYRTPQFSHFVDLQNYALIPTNKKSAEYAAHRVEISLEVEKIYAARDAAMRYQRQRLNEQYTMSLGEFCERHSEACAMAALSLGAGSLTPGSSQSTMSSNGPGNCEQACIGLHEDPFARGACILQCSLTGSPY